MEPANNENRSYTNPLAPVEHPYNPDIIANIRLILELNNANPNNTQQTYQTEIDGLCVVPRTSNLEFFENYKRFIHDSSTQMIITVFRGVKTPAGQKHIFNLKPKDSQRTLEGQASAPPQGYVTISQVHEMMEKQRLSIEFEKNKKKVGKLKEKLAEAEQYIAKLLAGIERYRMEAADKKHLLFDKLSTLASNPPDWLKLLIAKNMGAPAAVSLNGNLEGTDMDEDIEITRTSSDDEITEEQEEFINLMDAMQQRLTEDQFQQLMLLNDKLLNDPKLIQEVSTLIQ